MIIMALWLFFTTTRWSRATLRAYRSYLSTTTADRLATLLSPGRLTDSLVTALQEFQKTQVLFLLALQIVSLLALDHSSWLEAPTPVQVFYNTIFMTMLSTAGIYPIVLGLTMLRKNKGNPEGPTTERKDKGEIEGFTLLISLACIGVSSATWYRSTHIELNAGQLQHKGINLDDCGNVNPLQYCIGPWWGLASQGFNHEMVFFRQWLSVGPICAALYLTLETALPAMIRHGLIHVPTWSAKAWQSVKHPLIGIPSWVWASLKALLVFCIDAWLLVGNIVIFMNIYEVWAVPFDDGKVWTIGQVISVAVWVPVFLEWVYVVIREFPFGVGHGHKQADTSVRWC